MHRVEPYNSTNTLFRLLYYIDGSIDFISTPSKLCGKNLGEAWFSAAGNGSQRKVGVADGVFLQSAEIDFFCDPTHRSDSTYLSN